MRLIDADDFIERLHNVPIVQEAIKKAMDCMPTIERPQGEWIEVTNGRGGHECSICHSYAPSYMSGDEHLSKYCPNCGARMKGASDDKTYKCGRAVAKRT